MPYIPSGQPQPHPWSGKVAGFGNALGNNSDMLIALGLGLLDKRQNNAVPYSQIGQQAMQGSQLDQERKAKNMTVDWLVKQKGLSEEDAQAAVVNPVILSSYLSPKKNWAKLDDNTLFDAATGETMDAGGSGAGGGMFTGSSVDAQAFNYGIENGMWTREQAADMATGKTVTNPADGSMYFLSGRDLIRQAPDGTQTPAVPQGASGDLGPLPQPSGLESSQDAQVQVDPMQGTRLTPGKPPAKPGEREARNAQLYSVAAPELEIMEKTFPALSELGNQAAGALPLNDFITSAPYQQAKASLRTIVATYLYSTSGATANPGEVETQVDVLMPRPGEKQPSLDDKMNRIRTMVDSIRLGSGPAAPPGGTDLYEKYGLER